MKKIAYIMLLAFVLLLAACGSPAAESPETTTAMVQTTAAPELSEEEIYNEILSKLYKKLDYIIVDDTHLDGFSAQEGMVGVAEIASRRELDLLDKIGYAILDMNEDGVSELLIFSTDKTDENQRVLCAYTIADNKAVLLCAGDSPNAYYLLNDATVLNIKNNEDAWLSTGVFQLEQGSTKLTCADFYFAKDAGGVLTYYHNQTGTDDVAVSTVLEGGADALAAINGDLSAKIQTPEVNLMSAFGK